MSDRLTSAGYAGKDDEALRGALESAWSSATGAGVGTSTPPTIAKLFEAFLPQLSELWALTAALYESQYVASSQGVVLDNVASITGVERLAATSSQATVLVLGDQDTVLEPGRVVATRPGADRFVSTDRVVIGQALPRASVTIESAPADTEFTIEVGAAPDSVIATIQSEEGDAVADVASSLAGDLAPSLSDCLVEDEGNGSLRILAGSPSDLLVVSVSAVAPEHWRVEVEVLEGSTYTLTITGLGPPASQTVLTLSTFELGATDIQGLFPPVGASIVAEFVAQLNREALGLKAVDELNGKSLLIVQEDLAKTFTVSGGTGLTVSPATPTTEELISKTDDDVPAAEMTVESEEPGPVAAPARTLTRIETPVSGWSRAINLHDADLGRAQESDDELRVRRADSLQVGGFAVVHAIRARLVQDVEHVRDAFVIENESDAVDAAGRPPHTFEVVVDALADPEVDAAIARRIWELKAAGIRPVSTAAGADRVEVVLTDSMSTEHLVVFSRAATLHVWLQVKIFVPHPDETFPADGVEQIAADVLAFGETHDIGEDVVLGRFLSVVHRVPGIYDVEVRIATGVGSPGPFSQNNLAVGALEIASFDASRIDVQEMQL